MNNIRPGDLAVVVQGLWPNVGRVVFVCEFVPDFDFSAMGLGVRRRVGITPVGSLRKLEPLPPVQQRELEREMAVADFKDALADLAKILKEQYELAEV